MRFIVDSKYPSNTLELLLGLDLDDKHLKYEKDFHSLFITGLVLMFVGWDG